MLVGMGGVAYIFTAHYIFIVISVSTVSISIGGGRVHGTDPCGHDGSPVLLKTIVLEEFPLQ